MPMPGSSAAIREPWRMAAMWAGPDAVSGVASATMRAVLSLADRAPVTTSVGRLFDAVAALLGLRSRVNYEGQAAIELEALARTADRGGAPTLDGAVTTAVASGR